MTSGQPCNQRALNRNVAVWPAANEFAFNATGGRGFRLLKNDAELTGTLVRLPASTSAGNETRLTLTWQVLCAAGDKLSVEAHQQSGSALPLTTGSRMIVTKVHNTGPVA